MSQAAARSDVVMDNLSAHKAPAVREKIEATGASLLYYLPPYSPDLNPIEKCWAKIKGVFRNLKARTAEALNPAISEAIAAISSQDAIGWLHHCGIGTVNAKTERVAIRKVFWPPTVGSPLCLTPDIFAMSSILPLAITTGTSGTAMFLT